LAIVLPFRGLMPRIAPDVFVAETAVIIGDVEIGPGASIWYGCVLRGDVNRIRVGRNTNLQDGTVVHCNHDPEGDYRETGRGEPTLIGDDVVVGHMALIHACTVGNGAFIGMRSVILDRAVVESGAMVAAGALVAPDKVVRSGQLWGGVPARFMRELSEADRAAGPYIVAHYRELAAEHRARTELAAQAGRETAAEA
jgi:carbonic anhydrase/acetyltransferase-like protein (isoleucine patch superfamily)